MDHMSIITQVSNPKEEEIISFNQEKGKEKPINDREVTLMLAVCYYISLLTLAFCSRLLAALVTCSRLRHWLPVCNIKSWKRN